MARALSGVIDEIKEVLASARSNVARQVNSELLTAYWNIGRIICEYEQSEPDRADYGKRTLKELSRTLTQEFGKGFSVSNIQFMVGFIKPIQFNRQCLLNCLGRTTANCFPFPIRANAAFMKKDGLNQRIQRYADINVLVLLKQAVLQSLLACKQ